MKQMKILAIDTSCDDTAAAILAAEIPNSKSFTRPNFAKQKLWRARIPNFKILSNIVSSQTKIHQPYGGVYPTLAKREHQRNLPIVLKKALKGAEAEGAKLLPAKPVVDYIAVTVGPGLEPCLWTGINFAKELAKKWGLPIIPVNHIEAHILANFLPKIGEISNFQFPPKDPLLSKERRGPTGQAIFNEFSIFNFQKIFPAVALVVSGGHTQLILIKDISQYKIIGETRDDAAGECFDKTARILGLAYPGGPSIAASAAQFSIFNFQFSNKLKIKLPRPMIHNKDYDFSFSGLKTAVLYDYKKRPKKIQESKAYVRAMAKEIQQAIIDVLIKKTLKAAGDYKVKSILLGGGVAANDELKKQFNWKLEIGNWKLNFLAPPKNLCTDNAAMIAASAFFHQTEATYNLNKIEAMANLRL